MHRRRITGQLDAPEVGGTAVVSRGTLTCPWLKYPLTHLGASVSVRDGVLAVEALEVPLAWLEALLTSWELVVTACCL